MRRAVNLSFKIHVSCLVKAEKDCKIKFFALKKQKIFVSEIKQTLNRTSAKFFCFIFETFSKLAIVKKSKIRAVASVRQTEACLGKKFCSCANLCCFNTVIYLFIYLFIYFASPGSYVYKKTLKTITKPDRDTITVGPN